MDEDALKKAKTCRRTAKSAFTRAGKALTHAVEGKRPPQEVRETLSKLKGAYESLVVKHEQYAELIDDDEQYEKEKQWVTECREMLLQQEINAKLFIDSEEQSMPKGLEENVVASTEKEKDLSVGVKNDNGVPSMHTVKSQEIAQSNGMTSVQAITETISDHVNSSDTIQNTDEIINQNNPTPAAESTVQANHASQGYTSLYKLQKPKLPVFGGM